MAPRDPVPVYTAANKNEAHSVRDALLSSGVEALVAEVFYQGLQAQVWIGRKDIERAKPILEEYESRPKAWRDADNSNPKA
jgi:hypothetical protein